ncbi:MAG: redox-sensing transcriptional repressor Rex [Bacteroidales bacterium]|jgi:redox-sensing transcriptional repressor|nr:redox-sensing transcriptional repressor Rex [Bacteroidales bacterium]MDD4087446.1 redox-sensing transcriptional repressor Rex [Bacteroidales bacterium]
MKHLPHKTIERLSQYRRALLLCLEKGKTHIYSHEIAKIQHITSVQVRRDLMLIGYTGTLRKGYNVKELIDLIGNIIDSEEGIKVAIIGMGNLGRALINYFAGKRSKLRIVAGFDTNPDKIGNTMSGVPCYSIEQLKEVVAAEDIKVGIMTVPADYAVDTADLLVKAGIKGILNYTPKPVNVPEGVYLEEYDMITTLEKVAFYVKLQETD